MLTAIHLDYQSLSEVNKINCVIINWLLAAKFVSVRPYGAE